jgi:hypothetical protein
MGCKAKSITIKMQLQRAMPFNRKALKKALVPNSPRGLPDMEENRTKENK